MTKPPDMRVSISTDGTAAHSRAHIVRGEEQDDVSPESIQQASCSVRHFANGARCITATVWTKRTR